VDIEAVGKLILMVGCAAVENRDRGLCQLPINIILRRTAVQKGSGKLRSTTGGDSSNVATALMRFADLDTPSGVA
jgi:hypothetical protein